MLAHGFTNAMLDPFGAGRAGDSGTVGSAGGAGSRSRLPGSRSPTPGGRRLRDDARRSYVAQSSVTVALER
jgi:hypothetical protein